MQYFYRAHVSPDTVLEFADRFFEGRDFAGKRGTADHARFTGPLGTVDLNVEIEGGHHARVTAATGDVAESDLDKVSKRFLAELHQLEDPRHAVRGTY